MAKASPKAKGRVDLRIAARDRALFDRAAEVQSETLTQFLVESGRERAERLLADRTRFSVSAEQMAAMHAAMDRPAEARPELEKLFARTRPE